MALFVKTYGETPKYLTPKFHVSATILKPTLTQGTANEDDPLASQTGKISSMIKNVCTS